MDITAHHGPFIPFDNSYARELEGFYVPWQGEEAPCPRMRLFNEPLAEALGLSLDPSDPALAAFLSGGTAPEGALPLAQAYAGHQFGGFSPRLGDGRALLLGEVVDSSGMRFDLHLKGSGPTPFSRGGDGKAVLGPVLREYIMGEAMHALGIPTTRALGVIATGEQVLREGLKPGAVLARIAASHIRVGTFQFFAAQQDWEKVRQLADYAIARHDPELSEAPDKYLDFLRAVTKRQAALVAKWMQVGFIHGVMNTDNMAISGETIDYGPCAFMDFYDPETVFSSIDHHGRYAYGNQPRIAQWNLARLAETLVPLIDPDEKRAINLATDVLADYLGYYQAEWMDGMRVKIGLITESEEDEALLADLFQALRGEGVDFTGFFRALSQSLEGEKDQVTALFDDPEKIIAWLDRWRARLNAEPNTPSAIADAMDRVNPIYIPRNHLMEEALRAAEEEGDFDPSHTLLSVLSDPFTEREGLEDYARPAPASFGPHITYCGT